MTRANKVTFRSVSCGPFAPLLQLKMARTLLAPEMNENVGKCRLMALNSLLVVIQSF